MGFAKIIISWSMVLVVSVSLLAGCKTIGNASGSKKIPAKRLLFIPGQGPLHITWEARDLTISFKGRVGQNLLMLEGRIDITGEKIRHFAMLDRLVVDLYLTDSTGKVLDRLMFYSTDKSSIDHRIPRTFKHIFELPKGTSRIAFGYNGKARGSASKTLQKKKTAIELGFHHSPFR